MSYNVTYNGQVLDDIIPGYQTLNINGRGLLGRALDTVIVAGRAGDVVLGQRVPPRDITVYYLIKRTNNLEMQASLELLHAALSSEDDVIFQFGDEEYYRVGRLASVENPPYDSYSGVGSFTIHCQDPYRYSDPEEVPAENIPDTYVSDTVPVSMTVSIVADTTQLKITNSRTGKYILIRGIYLAGQTITFIFGNKPKIYVGSGQSILPELDLYSDFETFAIRAGDQIIVNPESPIEIIARRKVL